MPEANERHLLPVRRARRPASGLLVLELERPPAFTFNAGQAVSLRVGGESRPYSVASAPSEERLEFLVRLDEGFPERLASLTAGDVVAVSDPFGELTLDLRRPHQLMVAGGTGIAPFLSMLRDYYARGRPRHHFHLLHGESFGERFIYAAELRGLAERHPSHFRYRPFVSRPGVSANADWKGLVGRVGAHVPDYVGKHDLTAAQTQVYACGPKEMVDGVQRTLEPEGYRVLVEGY